MIQTLNMRVCKKTLFYNDPWLKKLTEYNWDSDQTWRCTDDSPCGGPDGQLSVYTDFKAKAVNTLEVQPINFKGDDVWDGATWKTTKMITVGEKVWIKATIGEYTCTSFGKCKGTVADDARFGCTLTFFCWWKKPWSFLGGDSCLSYYGGQFK